MLVEGVSEMLWEFGFRHHPELQKKWIDGVAGLATVAKVSEEKPQDDPFDDAAREMLAAANPKLLETIRKAPPEERQRLLKQLEKNFAEISALIETLKEQ